jgi:hypothetical protein
MRFSLTGQVGLSLNLISSYALQYTLQSTSQARKAKIYTVNSVK